jgi:hypothetical protein
MSLLQAQTVFGALHALEVTWHGLSTQCIWMIIDKKDNTITFRQSNSVPSIVADV